MGGHERAYSFDISGDYKAQIERIIDGIEEEAPSMPREERIRQISALIDEYVAQTGERPDSRALYRLGSVILHEELTDSNPHKVARESYPILSDRQLVRRDRRELRRGAWNVNRDYAVGFRKGYYFDGDGSVRATRQAIFKRD